MQSIMKNIHGLCVYLFLLSWCLFSTVIQAQKIIEPGASQLQEYLILLQGKKVGAVVNNASLVNNARLVDTLISRGVSICKIFSPEHGFYGKTEAGQLVDNSLFNNTIPVLSLYGKKVMPSADDLRDIEIMIFDLQDVGVRFYTYLSTLHYVMKACAKNKIPIIVLDRPNPNGFYFDGPVLEDKFRSFVGMHPVPVVYGMTIGEYACMIQGEKWLGDSADCSLTVISCKNYDHSSFYEPTVNPSPNLRCIRAEYLYPSLAFFEGTVVSVGRGTNSPFMVIGHPDYPVKDFSFVPESIAGVSETPPLKDRICFGLDMRDYSIDSLQSNGKIELRFLLEMYQKLNLGKSFFNDYFDKLAGNSSLRKDILSGKSEKEIRNSWQPGLDEFKKIRAKYLIYPDFK
jgi:uncharacterized protein YbbC (DUF1343 family)